MEETFLLCYFVMFHHGCPSSVKIYRWEAVFKKETDLIRELRWKKLVFPKRMLERIYVYICMYNNGDYWTAAMFVCPFGSYLCLKARASHPEDCPAVRGGFGKS